MNDEQLRCIAELRQYPADKLCLCKFQRLQHQKALPLMAICERIVSGKSPGGIQPDLHSRVPGLPGQAISVLYAVGEAAGFGGGMHGWRAFEGKFLGGCILSGRLAVKAIASVG